MRLDVREPAKWKTFPLLSVDGLRALWDGRRVRRRGPGIHGEQLGHSTCVQPPVALLLLLLVLVVVLVVVVMVLVVLFVVATGTATTSTATTTSGGGEMNALTEGELAGPLHGRHKLLVQQEVAFIAVTNGLMGSEYGRQVLRSIDQRKLALVCGRRGHGCEWEWEEE